MAASGAILGALLASGVATSTPPAHGAPGSDEALVADTRAAMPAGRAPLPASAVAGRLPVDATQAAAPLGGPVRATDATQAAARPGGLVLTPDATRAAARPGGPVLTTDAAPDARVAATAIAFAMRQLGLPYVWGGNGPAAGDAGFDCSGLTTASYAAAAVGLPRTAHTQFHSGPHVPANAELMPGDLVFYGTVDRVHHVGMYLGEGRMVNAPTFGEPVQVAQVRYAGDDYLGATRPAAAPGSFKAGLLSDVVSSTRGSGPATRVPGRFEAPRTTLPSVDPIATLRAAPATAAVPPGPAVPISPPAPPAPVVPAVPVAPPAPVLPPAPAAPPAPPAPAAHGPALPATPPPRSTAPRATVPPTPTAPPTPAPTPAPARPAPRPAPSSATPPATASTPAPRATPLPPAPPSRVAPRPTATPTPSRPARPAPTGVRPRPAAPPRSPAAGPVSPKCLLPGTVLNGVPIDLQDPRICR